MPGLRLPDQPVTTGVDEVVSYVKVTNVRGRRVVVEHTWLMKRGRMSGPKGWLEGVPYGLDEGATVSLTFHRGDSPVARPVAIDSAGRVWPRRWRPLLNWRGFRARGRLGFSKGPSEKHWKRRRRLAQPRRED